MGVNPLRGCCPPWVGGGAWKGEERPGGGGLWVPCPGPEPAGAPPPALGCQQEQRGTTPTVHGDGRGVGAELGGDTHTIPASSSCLSHPLTARHPQTITLPQSPHRGTSCFCSRGVVVHGGSRLPKTSHEGPGSPSPTEAKPPEAPVPSAGLCRIRLGTKIVLQGHPGIPQGEGTNAGAQRWLMGLGDKWLQPHSNHTGNESATLSTKPCPHENHQTGHKPG